MHVGLRGGMRRVLLFVTFLSLVVAICAMWAFRFERRTGMPVITLRDLKSSAPSMPGVEWAGTGNDLKLRVRVDENNPRVAVRLLIPGLPPVSMLHFQFRMTSRHLMAGREPWEDGRFLLEWHPTDGEGEWESDPLGSIRDDIVGEPLRFVTNPQRGPALPVLRLEHLGRSGEFELSDLEITVVQERGVWKIGRWFLAGGWFLWALACIRCWKGIPPWRAIAASLVWVLLGIDLVVPGPWKFQRAIYPEFQLGSECAASSVGNSTGPLTDSAIVRSGAVKPLGKIPDQGAWILRVKHLIADARPLLHALMVFGPALLISCLVGRKPAMLLVGILAVAVELGEIGFGYGFGMDDVLDLLNDSIGIACAIWVHSKLVGKFRFLGNKSA